MRVRLALFLMAAATLMLELVLTRPNQTGPVDALPSPSAASR